MAYRAMKKIQHPEILLYIPGLLAAFIYGRTLAPTLQVADAGEQITAAHFLGISHPTGTPLYLLLMKGWEMVFPFGTVAWRMNLLNAVLGSITVIIFAKLMYRIFLYYDDSIKKGLVFAWGSALALAFSKSYWYESLAASSYLLQYLFVVIWLYLITKIVLKGDFRSLPTLFFLTGLALANHVLSLILLFMTFWYALSLFLRKKISLRALSGLPFFLLPGLLFYIYIPLRAAADPVINWGDPNTFSKFIQYVSRKEYYSKIYVSDLYDLFEVTAFHIKSFFQETSLLLLGILVCLVVMQIYRRIKGSHERDRRIDADKDAAHARNISGIGVDISFQLILLGVMLMILNLFFLSLHGSHLDLFFLKRYMVTGYIGLLFSFMVFVARAQKFCGHRFFKGIIALILIIPFLCLSQFYDRNNRSENTLLRSFVMQVFSHIPEGATLFAKGDNYLFAAMYYHLVEGYRPDLTLYNPKIGLDAKAPIPVLIKNGQLFSSHYMNAKPPVKIVPAGLVFKVTTGENGRKKEISWSGFIDREIRRVQAPLEKIMLADYYYRRSVYHEIRNEKKQQLLWIRKMESVADGYDQTLMLTGRAYARYGMIPKALKYFRDALKINRKNHIAMYYLKRYGGEG